MVGAPPSCVKCATISAILASWPSALGGGAIFATKCYHLWVARSSAVRSPFLVHVPKFDKSAFRDGKKILLYWATV